MEQDNRILLFQSTHPHGVRLHPRVSPSTILWFQSTHPHGVRLSHTLSFILFCVSIHAPTRGATGPLYRNPFLRCCFNPRTHTGCDSNQAHSMISYAWFQSTHPHGVRHRSSPCRSISWGSFNPRTHTGCDLTNLTFWVVDYMVSIHAPTRGATLSKIYVVRRLDCFNPRTHTGCDTPFLQASYDLGYVSIHAPTRGAT